MNLNEDYFEYLTYPLCATGDLLNNPNGCTTANGVFGHPYSDADTNCEWNVGEEVHYNIPVRLYDASGSLLGQTTSNGAYHFPVFDGTYTVSVDTAGMPYVVQCQYPGVDSTVILSGAEPLAQVDFNIICEPGQTDVGVQSITSWGWVFPGENHAVDICAGEISCPSSLGGTINVTISGPATYSGVNQGALVPSVSGNVLTYNVPDFSDAFLGQLYDVVLSVDSTAQIGDSICVSVSLTPAASDTDPSNNTIHYCYAVVNSYDPNMKEVYPVHAGPDYDGWFTYTLHFQNTGSAPAFNIRLLDTLDTDLDLGSFEALSYSHPGSYSLFGNTLTVHFSNIMLPDSTTDEAGSHGYFKYRIKPKANLPLGSLIENTCRIFFDFNAPIVTNTVVSDFAVSVPESEKAIQVRLYPNPTTGQFTIETPESGTTVFVYDLAGSLISNRTNTSLRTSINIEGQAPGMYMVVVHSRNGIWHGKVIKGL